MTTATPTRQQMLRLNVFRTFAAQHPNPDFDTGDAIKLFNSVNQTLRELARDHPDRFNRHSSSSRLEQLQTALGSSGNIYDKADTLDFDVTEHLLDLKLWLTANAASHRLTVERLEMFLNLAREGRNTFTAADFDPKLFVPDDTLWLVTVLTTAYNT